MAAFLKWLIPLAVLFGLSWVSVTYLGAQGWIVAGLMAFGMVGLLGLIGLKLPAVPMLSKKFALILMIAGIGAAVFFSGVTGIFMNWVNPGTLTPGTEAAPASTNECRSGVSMELLGKSSTADINAYDFQSNTPYSAAIDHNPTQIYIDGVHQVAATDTSGATINSAVGQVICTYGGGTTYYGEEQCFCVEQQRQALELRGHTVATETNMVITGYQDDAVTALTAGTTDEEDYEIAMGADEDYTFYLKLKVNDADERFQLGGICTIANGDVDGCELKEADWSPVVIPAYLANADVAINDTQALNLTGGYEKCWVPSEVVVMEEWDSEKYQFVISSDSDGTDALDGGSATAASDLCVVQFLDAAWSRGVDGKMYFDFHDHGLSGSEANVGMAETLTSPYQKDTGVIIEAT